MWCWTDAYNSFVSYSGPDITLGLLRTLSEEKFNDVTVMDQIVAVLYLNTVCGF